MHRALALRRTKLEHLQAVGHGALVARRRVVATLAFAASKDSEFPRHIERSEIEAYPSKGLRALQRANPSDSGGQ